ncbi:Radical SAM domain protein [Candidatus Sulfopaludibacter sp. SbA3]|nr:Radical SAM domain protein [Candidatus Sulfopaludibacter sp. SbA3]
MLAPLSSSIVLQPTSLCNLNCAYCYLPDRDKNLIMPLEVADAVARSIAAFQSRFPVSLIWHGGEPLATPIRVFETLVNAFELLRRRRLVVHELQTNATLISPAWCDLFQRYGFRIGVSVDGPPEYNTERVDWAGHGTFARTLKGVDLLRRAGIPFTAIAVIGEGNIDHPEAIYDFFCRLGCFGVGFNIEEREGVNINRPLVEGLSAGRFWRGILTAWRTNPVIRIREFERSFGYVRAVLENDERSYSQRRIDPFPTVAYNGDVVFLSPELAGLKNELYDDFKIGNVLEHSLLDMFRKALDIRYVAEFVEGVEECARVCLYYGACGGGQAVNKLYELGTMAGTETSFCRNGKIRLLDAIIDAA